MSVESPAFQRDVFEKTKVVPDRREFVASRNGDTRKFIALYFLATGNKPSAACEELLYDFTDFTLRQSTGKFDENADKMAAKYWTRHADVSKVYWPDEYKEEYIKFVGKVKKFVKDGKLTERQGRVVFQSIRTWHKAMTHLESSIRGIEPTRDMEPRLRSGERDPNIKYREELNLAYMEAMLGIANPGSPEENTKLARQVVNPVMMSVQCVVDYAQHGLSQQDSKPTMQKAGGVDYDSMPPIKKSMMLTLDCAKHTASYIRKIRSSNPLKTAILRIGATVADTAMYGDQFYKYQVKKSKDGRYI